MNAVLIEHMKVSELPEHWRADQPAADYNGPLSGNRPETR